MKHGNMDKIFEKIFQRKPSKRGKGFELLTGAVLKIINEAQDVTHDVRKTGLFSSDSYQIDALIDDCGKSIFVETKDYSERNAKTGREDIQKLAGALNNLDINNGLLVSSTGFTEHTVKYSQSTKANPNAKEINLCIIRPVNKKDTENLIFEFVVNATFQRINHEKSKAEAILNQNSLKQALKELKDEGYKPGVYKAIFNRLFDKNGEHVAYLHEIITTKLPSEEKHTHKGTWVPDEEIYAKIENKLIKVDGIKYEFVYETNHIKNFVHIKEEPILIAKSEDLGLDYIITKRQLEGITFKPDGSILYKERYR